MEQKFSDYFKFKQKEVDHVYKSSERIASCLGIRVLHTSDEFSGKFLVITPRKTGKAHERNKLRRQVKSIIFEEKLYELSGTYVIILYHQAQKLSFDQIKQFLLKLSAQ